jgi:hypothetical protein
MAPFEKSDGDDKKEDIANQKSSNGDDKKEDMVNQKSSMVELPDEKIVERTITPPAERAKTQMKFKIPELDLEKVATENPPRLHQLAKTDRNKQDMLEKKKEEKELASCTFMPNSTQRTK